MQNVEWQRYRAICSAGKPGEKVIRFQHTFAVMNSGEERAKQFIRGRTLVGLVVEGMEKDPPRNVWAKVDPETFSIGTVEHSNPYPGDAG